MSDIIQAEYQTLEEIAQQFQALADRVHDSHRELNFARGDLDGEWEGYGGESFFQEMDMTILPAMLDLKHALADTGIIIEHFKSEFEDAEHISSTSWWDRWGEKVHFGLDVIGFIPGLGEIADGANALIYLAEGRYVEAGISAAAMIPIWGDLGKVGKWGVSSLGVTAFKIGDASSLLSKAKYLRHLDQQSFETLMKSGANNTTEINTILNKAGTNSVIRGYTDSMGNQIILTAGNRSKGLRHVLGRHLTGEIPGVHTTLFPPGAKVGDISTAIGNVLQNGSRNIDSNTGNIVYTSIHKKYGEMKVIVNQSGEIVSAYPTK